MVSGYAQDGLSAEPEILTSRGDACVAWKPLSEGYRPSGGHVKTALRIISMQMKHWDGFV